MTLKILYHRSFERDLKKMKKRKKNLSKLKELTFILASQEKVPNRNRNHKLTGNFQGYWECHIEPDWLLIYKKTPQTIIFLRTGSHSDLF